MIRDRNAKPDLSMTIHRLLLRVSGSAPDALVALARVWLAEGWLSGVVRTLAFAVHAGYFEITEEEAVLFQSLLRNAGDESFATRLPHAPLRDVTLPFEVVGEDHFRGGWSGSADKVEEAASIAVLSCPGALQLWRAWRVPIVATLYPSPKRFFLVLAAADADAIQLTVRIQRALAEAGERDPLVEVFDNHTVLPDLSRRATRAGDLLWTTPPSLADRPGPGQLS
ncbi:hypothetical protein [Actinoplanes sp. NBRC 103695]|uniref:hypothetical protein n=1 Tax=Actinoplanes sp. NBRC 103695 TaxID=3032202 RepID=UPI0024A3E30D|nr:hypothetical protein [Actinoplanes sp. NBRC 103695]GLZ02353.1 hypothetical protein Acsp02_96040 [Actinoplanes sp. NBRC 103695]